MNNEAIARRLTEHANELSRRQGGLYRIRAYRQAAQTIQGLDRPLTELLGESGEGLAALPGVGTHLAFTIERLARTGEFLTYEEGTTRGVLPRRRARKTQPAA
jgi:DNA polymerase/3'-5' exonuclease PolX